MALDIAEEKGSDRVAVSVLWELFPKVYGSLLETLEPVTSIRPNLEIPGMAAGAGRCRNWDPGTRDKQHHHTRAPSKASIHEEHHHLYKRIWLRKVRKKKRKKRNNFWVK